MIHLLKPIFTLLALLLAEQQSAEAVIAYVHGADYFGNRRAVFCNHVSLIDGQKIVAVRTGQHCQIPADAQIDTLKGKFAIIAPGPPCC